MEKKKKLNISHDIIKVILILVGSALSCLVLVFVAAALIEMNNANMFRASLFLLGIFVVLGLSRLVTFLRERTKLNFFRFLFLLIYDVGLGIIILFAKDTPYLYHLCGGLYCVSIIISRVFKMIQVRTTRSIVFNSIIAAFAAALGIALLIPAENVGDVVIFTICIIVAVSTFIEVITNGASKFNATALIRIILRTYALEIIMGLLTTIVAFSLILMIYEDSIPTFFDGLWYSFAVVTTIGFGDIVATSIIGRVITIILGVYGLIVVAVITSIIVNFYNEMAGKKEQKEIKEIADESNKEKTKKK